MLVQEVRAESRGSLHSSSIYKLKFELRLGDFLSSICREAKRKEDQDFNKSSKIIEIWFD
jgi:hypothetical protein